MSQSLMDVTAYSLRTLDGAVARLARLVPPPKMSVKVTGNKAYRYDEKSFEQAIVLKTVRLASAAHGAVALLAAGLTLEVGVSMRIMDEVGADIHFLTGPKVSGQAPERNHQRFLTEFFQEEFDHIDPIKATQKRDRVSRKDIRAYNARVSYAGIAPVSKVVDVLETIDNTFSGYVHGAGGHILDVYDGRQFVFRMGTNEKPLRVLQEMLMMYLHRALMDMYMATAVLGGAAAGAELYEAITTTFDEYGNVR